MDKFLISIGVWIISTFLGSAVGIQIAQLIGLTPSGQDWPNLMVIYPILISTCIIYYFLQKKVLSYIESSNHRPDATQNWENKNQPVYRFTDDIEIKPFLNFFLNVFMFCFGVFILILVVLISWDLDKTACQMQTGILLGGRAIRHPVICIALLSVFLLNIKWIRTIRPLYLGMMWMLIPATLLIIWPSWITGGCSGRLKSSAEDIYPGYIGSKNLEMPVQHFDKPFNEKISPEQKGQEQTMGYKSYIKNGNYQKAIDSLSRFLNLRANSPYLRKTILIQRGDLLMVTGKYQEALDDYTECLEIIRRLQNGNVPENQTYIDEGSSLCLLKRGIAYRRLELFDNAISDLNTAINEKPEQKILKDCYLQRGLVYKAMNNIENFQNDFKELPHFESNLVEGFYVLDDNRWIKYGKFIWYYEDGTPKVECNYQNDEIVGACKYFNPDGSVK